MHKKISLFRSPLLSLLFTNKSMANQTTDSNVTKDFLVAYNNLTSAEENFTTSGSLIVSQTEADRIINSLKQNNTISTSHCPEIVPNLCKLSLINPS